MIKRFIILVVFAVTLTSYAEDKPVKIKYKGKIEIKNLHNQLCYVLNRKYVFTDVPRYLLFSKINIMDGNAHKSIKAEVPIYTTLYLCLDSGMNMKKAEKTEVEEYAKSLRSKGWRYSGRILTSDKRMRYVKVYMKKYYQDTKEEFSGVGFPGIMLVAKSMELEKEEK